MSIAQGDNLWAAGDQGCLLTAAANFDLCKSVCTGAIFDCQNSFEICIANCPNL
jgi:hypothetical protein